MSKQYDVIIIGAGLAGITVAYKLAKENKKILLIEKEKYLGGRTSSWNDNGMEIESGFHRHIGYYTQLPKLLNETGVNLDDIIMWEKESEIILDKDKRLIVGIDPFRHPITFMKDGLGNKEILTLKDKLSLLKLFTIGFKDYMFHPQELDKYSILKYSKKLKIEKKITDTVTTSLSTGIFFLPTNKYSAKLYFGLFYPAIYKPWKVRIGAYKGGMSDKIINPIAEKIIEFGGTIKKNTAVKSLIEKNNQIIGIKTDKQEFFADYVVLATDIGNAKEIIKTINHPFKETILQIPTISVITVQFELSKSMMPLDRTTFTTSTIIASFTEESRSTFKNSKGRLSIILKSTNDIIAWNDKKIISETIMALNDIGIYIEEYIINHRIVRHISKFYDFSYNNDNTRISQKTPIKGLIIAGDYTKQKLYSTMEGAVISGLNAFDYIIKRSKL